MVTRHRDSPWVFHSPRGKRLSKGNLNYLWRPVAAAWRAQGGRDVDLYELRHACATLLLERGLTPADVAVQVGGSCRSFTDTPTRSALSTVYRWRLQRTATTQRSRPLDSAKIRPQTSNESPANAGFFGLVGPAVSTFSRIRNALRAFARRAF
jgi:integrase